MGFIPVPRYHIGCDTPKCVNVLGIVEFDLDDNPIDLYMFEAVTNELSQPIVDLLYANEWVINKGFLYCPVCSVSVTNSVFNALKTDMGYN